MRFLLDESADARLAAHLRGLGHDATTVAGDYQPGLPDHEVLALARREGRILITDDHDFGELVVRHRLPHTGVIYFRLDTTLLAVKVGRLDQVLADHADQLDQFLTVTKDRIRVGQPVRE